MCLSIWMRIVILQFLQDYNRRIADVTRAALRAGLWL
jgi:hypothetical protein